MICLNSPYGTSVVLDEEDKQQHQEGYLTPFTELPRERKFAELRTSREVQSDERLEYMNDSEQELIPLNASKSGFVESSYGSILMRTPFMSTVEHKVCHGDTLASIAVKYGVSVDDLKCTNGFVTDYDLLRRPTVHVPMHFDLSSSLYDDGPKGSEVSPVNSSKQETEENNFFEQFDKRAERSKASAHVTLQRFGLT